MKKTNYYDVGEFNKKFSLGCYAGCGDAYPYLMEQRDFEFRLRFMLEEITELIKAYSHENLPDVADALIDIVYVTMGAGQLMRLPWEALWDEVQRANMAKEQLLGKDDPRNKRGYDKDIVKPEGWRPPDLAKILRVHGWRG